jgi:hypothetical protein
MSAQRFQLDASATVRAWLEARPSSEPRAIAYDFVTMIKEIGTGALFVLGQMLLRCPRRHDRQAPRSRMAASTICSGRRIG